MDSSEVIALARSHVAAGRVHLVGEMAFRNLDVDEAADVILSAFEAWQAGSAWFIRGRGDFGVVTLHAFVDEGEVTVIAADLP